MCSAFRSIAWRWAAPLWARSRTTRVSLRSSSPCPPPAWTACGNARRSLPALAWRTGSVTPVREQAAASTAMAKRGDVAALALIALAASPPSVAQRIPGAACTVEDYGLQSVVAWQFPKIEGKVQVVVLRDPGGEQEARFHLRDGRCPVCPRSR